MSSNNTAYELISQLLPDERKEISFLLHASALRSGGKWNTYFVFDTIAKHNPITDVQLREHLPENLKNIELRRIKATLVRKVLAYLVANSDDAGIQLRRIRSEIDLLLKYRCFREAEGLLAKGIVLASAERAHLDRFIMQDQLNILTGRKMFEGELVHSLDIEMEVTADINDVNFQNSAFIHYIQSQTSKEEGTDSWASMELEDPVFRDCEHFPPYFRTLVYRAGANYCHAASRWSQYISWLSRLIELLSTDSAGGLDHLKLKLPDYSYSLGIGALAANQPAVWEHAVAQLKGYDTSGQYEVERIKILLLRLTVAKSVKYGKSKKALQAVRDAVLELNYPSISADDLTSPEVISIMANYAFQTGDWESAARYSYRYLVIGKYSPEVLLVFNTIRVLSLIELNDPASVVAASKDAVSMIDNIHLGEFGKDFFIPLSKLKPNVTRAKMVSHIVGRSWVFLKDESYRRLNSALNLFNRLKKIN